MNNLLTAREAAPVLKVSEAALRRYARLGIIPCIRLGRLLRFDPDALQRWRASFFEITGGLAIGNVAQSAAIEKLD